MGYTSDTITSAIRINLDTNERVRIDAADIDDPGNTRFQYFCADCFDKGQQVRLKHVKAADRKYTFAHWNKITGEPLKGEDGENLTKEKNYIFPAHFDRWPGTKDHRCNQAVRYAAFRETALHKNALQTGMHSFVFPIRLPQQGGWNDHDGKRPTDLRSSFRPVGMGLGGLDTADSFLKLLTHFKRDPGLQHYQHFHDGFSVRHFNQMFFDNPLALHTFLKQKNAVGRDQSVIVAYLLNPNTSLHAIKDVHDGFVDRSMPKLDDGQKLQLFVRGMNRPAQQSLSEAGRRHGWFNRAPVLVFGEARIDADDHHQVAVEFYNPAQIAPWEEDMQFLPKFKPGNEAQIALEI